MSDDECPRFIGWLMMFGIDTPFILDKTHRFYIYTQWENGEDHSSGTISDVSKTIFDAISRAYDESFSVYVWDFKNKAEAKLIICTED